MTNQASIESFAAYRRAEKGLAKLTIDAYRQDLKQFAGWLRRPIDVAGFQDFRDYEGHLLSTAKSSSTARKVSTLRHFYKFLFMDRMIAIDPMHRVQSPKIGRALPKFLSTAEVDSILTLPTTADSKTLRDRAIVELLYGAALRVSELAGARLGDLNLTERFVVVHGKGDKERIAPFGHRAALALKLHLDARPHFSPWLFAGHWSQHRKNHISRQGVWKIVREHCLALGKTVSPHALRHSCATHMLESGATSELYKLFLDTRI
jgi:integrase/recombinase XerD